MDIIVWVGPPELAVASIVAEGCCAAAEGGRGFDYRLKRRALPHEAGRFQVLTATRQFIWRKERKQEREGGK